MPCARELLPETSEASFPSELSDYMVQVGHCPFKTRSSYVMDSHVSLSPPWRLIKFSSLNSTSDAALLPTHPRSPRPHPLLNLINSLILSLLMKESVNEKVRVCRVLPRQTCHTGNFIPVHTEEKLIQFFKQASPRGGISEAHHWLDFAYTCDYISDVYSPWRIHKRTVCSYLYPIFRLMDRVHSIVKESKRKSLPTSSRSETWAEPILSESPNKVFPMS